MEEGVLCLKWRDHRPTFTRTLATLRNKGWYCDATLTCEGRLYPVHRLVLGMCSELFQSMWEACDHQQQVMVVLADLSHQDLEALLDYMYLGEANILQGDLARFMRAAEALKIRGLAEPVLSSPLKETDDGKALGAREDARAVREDTRGPREDARVLRVDARATREDTRDAKRSLAAREDTWEAKRRRDNNTEKPEPRTSQGGCVDSRRPGQDKGEQGEEGTEIVSPVQLATVELDTRPDSAGTHTQSSPVKFENVNIKEEVEWGGGGTAEEPQAYTSFSDPDLAYFTGHATSHSTTTSQHHTVSAPQKPGVVWAEGGVVAESGGQCQPMPYRSPAQRRMGRPTSEIWSHYSVDRSGGKTVVFCKYCSQRYSHPNATKMRIHVSKCERCPGEVRRQFSGGVKLETETVTLKLGEAGAWQSRPSQLKVPQPVFSRVDSSDS